jgi:hypothetical protein
LTGSVLSALAVLLVYSSRAEASCGDYLMLKGQHEHTAANPRSPHSDHQMPWAPAPCQGPFCSGRHKVPPLAPAAPAPVNGQEWGFVSSDPVPAVHGRVDFLDLDDFGIPIHQGSSIFHPPR